MSKQIRAGLFLFLIGALFIVAALINNVGVSPWWLVAVAAGFLAISVRYLIRGLRRRSE